MYVLGAPGGVLFEHYVLFLGSCQDVRLLNKRLNANHAIPEYNPIVIFKRYVTRFWLFAAQTMYHVFNRCWMPLTHFCLQMQYRGLSRMGRSLASAMGVLPSVSNYDQKCKNLLGEYDEKLISMARGNKGIVAFDNYCRVFGSGNISLARDSSYTKANNTVVAMSAYDFKVRPTFKWTLIDPDTAVASLPMHAADLLDFKKQVASLTL